MTAQEHISKVARMLANQQADACGVDREDNWRLYGEEFIAATAEAMSSVLAHIDQQQAEIERLRSESEERLQNCAALVAEVEGLRAAPATAPDFDEALSRVLFERHWRKTRGQSKAERELKRHPLQPQTYVQDSANRHFVTWQAAIKSNAPATAPEPLVPLTLEWEPGYPEDKP